MKENWKDIPGYEGHYKVSDLGRVKSLDRTIERSGVRGNANVSGKLLNPKIHKSGYIYVRLGKKQYRLHQLVAMAFLNFTPCGMNMVIDHIDENKTNNSLFNLRIVDNRENCIKGKMKYNNTSKYPGVYKNKSRKKLKSGEVKIYDNYFYQAQIKIDGDVIYLGANKNEDICKRLYEIALQNIRLYNGDKKLFREKINKMI